MQTYEVEIKSLLGSAEAAEVLRKRFHVVDPAHALTGTNKQLNHYFHAGPMDILHERVAELVPEHEHPRLAHIITNGKSFSVRTRQADNTVLLVIKASIDDTTSENGISRIEFESTVPHTLEALDTMLVDAGFPYQAKWSREREEYAVRGVTVTIDKNAGYGYVAELEKVVNHPDHVPPAREELRALMNDLGIEELPQDRLERMFAHYNKHWPEYYGTNNIFSIE
jgi:predicted adenylyl cyclase CyaB